MCIWASTLNFAMVHPGQAWPGDPIGYVTAEQVNEVQSTIQRYMRRNRIDGLRVLLVHQFQSDMIVEPEEVAPDDGSCGDDYFGRRVGRAFGEKITKYNSFVTADSPFAAFKLFYQWDEPVLTPGQALGEEWYADTDLIVDITPNMIIYQ